MPTRAELANAIRALSIDAIEKAKSGHPGAPLGMADMAEALWRGFLKHNPADPAWPNRDRFVLSNGHASMLLYALLHLTGYDLSMDDIRNFRQLGAKTPGHPEFGVTPGVEMTTGPLGQGIATAVGMALAECMMARAFNRDGFPIMDHYTWVFLGDGCLMEGVSQESCSLAGTWKLGRLIAFYDDNDISIDGKVEGWFTDDTPARFEAMGWHVVRGVDGHDSEALDMAIRQAMAVTDKPSLICCKTVIGRFAPTKAGTASCHGAPLGAEEAAAARAAMGWTAEPFTVPEDIRAAWDAREKGAAAQKAWEDMFAAYAEAYPELAAEFRRRMAGELPAAWPAAAREAVANAMAETKDIATRVAGKNVLNVIAPVLPELVGGSADLSGSVGTEHKNAKTLDVSDYSGNYIRYGVREFGMGAIMNGLKLHGGFIPYAGTFFVFSDYAKSVIRSAALMKIRVIWVLTHDSIGVGEDGPTHQPVEQIAALRMTPGVQVWRPCDSTEAAVAWTAAVEYKDGPVCLVMSRQSLPQQSRSEEQVAAIRRGGYVLRDCEGEPELIYIATGSEVQLAVQAAEKLAAEGRRVRVVSMPSCEVFDRQDSAYRESVLPSSVRARVAVEAQTAAWWWKYVGLDGRVVGMGTFGASAPAGKLFPKFGFTVENIVQQALELL
ncbi:transketolase [Mailhella sp.]|uniref:transketolase n=1 Tax=Mailhella sp. TaxID=1981029 RepID=UPI003AB2C163